jgi:transposase-like protein
MRCPYCRATEDQVRSGRNGSGSQRWLCKRCQRKYTPEPREIGYDELLRKRALQMVMSGLSLRQVARGLRVARQTIANWVNADAGCVPDSQPPTPVEDHDANRSDS